MSDWQPPKDEPCFTYGGHKWQYVRLRQDGKTYVGYLSSLDDMVYTDFRQPDTLALP